MLSTSELDNHNTHASHHRQAQRRIAPDGHLYTRADFQEFFGGLTEWHDATPGHRSKPSNNHDNLRRPVQKLAASNELAKHNYMARTPIGQVQQLAKQIYVVHHRPARRRRRVRRVSATRRRRRVRRVRQRSNLGSIRRRRGQRSNGDNKLKRAMEKFAAEQTRYPTLHPSSRPTPRPTAGPTRVHAFVRVVRVCSCAHACVCLCACAQAAPSADCMLIADGEKPLPVRSARPTTTAPSIRKIPKFAAGSATEPTPDPTLYPTLHPSTTPTAPPTAPPTAALSMPHAAGLGSFKSRVLGHLGLQVTGPSPTTSMPAITPFFINVFCHSSFLGHLGLQVTLAQPHQWRP